MNRCTLKKKTHILVCLNKTFTRIENIYSRHLFESVYTTVMNDSFTRVFVHAALHSSPPAVYAAHCEQSDEPMAIVHTVLHTLSTAGRAQQADTPSNRQSKTESRSRHELSDWSKSVHCKQT